VTSGEIRPVSRYSPGLFASKGFNIAGLGCLLLLVVFLAVVFAFVDGSENRLYNRPDQALGVILPDSCVGFKEG
jgi:hypothetical protein